MIRTAKEQHAAYADGYREGELVRKGYVRRSEYLYNARFDFQPGSWSQQHAQGYYDGIHALKQKPVVYN